MHQQLLSAEEGRDLEKSDEELLVQEFRLPSKSFLDDEDDAESTCTWKPCLFGMARCYRFRNSHNTVGVILLSLAVICVSLAASLYPLTDYVVSAQVEDAVVTDSPHADGYKTWQSNTREDSQPVYFDVYVFDIANMNDMLNNSATPALVEKGPYAYREQFEKFDVKFENGGKRVSFYQYWYYVFDEERSGPGLKPSDPVHTPNLLASGLKVMLQAASNDASVVLQAPERLRGYQQVLRHPLVSSALSLGADVQGSWHGLLKVLLCTGDEASPVTTLPMNDVYWGFFGDPVLTAIGNLLEDTGEDVPWSTYVPGVSSNYSSRAEVKRRSNRHLYYTGKGDIKKIDQVIRYANMSEQYLCAAAVGSPGATWDDAAEQPPACKAFNHDWTEEEAGVFGWAKVWGSDDANSIYGTDASQYTPGRYNRDNAPTYISDIYRSNILGFVKEYTWKGIHLRRFGLKNSDLYTSNCESTTGGIDDAQHCNPANADFYSYSMWGVLNFTTVGGGVPLFASKPHFLTGDPWLVSQVSGLEPNPAIHETYVDIEPITGYAFRAAKRLQVGAIIDDNWDMPSISVGGDLKKEAIMKVLQLVEQELVQKLEDQMNETVAEWCDHSAEHREEHCADVEKAVEGRCQSEQGCPAVTEIKRLVDGAKNVVSQIQTQCQSNSINTIACQKAKKEIQDAVTEFCNSSSGSNVCDIVKVAVNDVEQFWDALDGICKTGLCESAARGVLTRSESCREFPDLCGASFQAKSTIVPTPGLLIQASQWASSRSHRPEFHEPIRILHGALLQSIVQNFNFTGDRAHAYEQCLHEPSTFTIPESGYYMPIAWVNEHFDLQDDNVKGFKTSVTATLTLAQEVAFWLYVAGAALAVSGFMWFASVKYWLWATPVARKCN